MHFKRIADGLSINPPKKIKTAPQQPYPPSLFPLPTLHAFIGERGKGKTYNCTLYAYKLISEGYASRIYIVSPTFDSQDIFQLLPLYERDIFKSTEDKDDMNVLVHAENVLNAIITDIKEDYELYNEQESYSSVLSKMDIARKKGEKYVDQNVVDRQYIESMQDRISYAIWHLRKRLELWDEQQKTVPYDEEFGRGVQFPEDELTRRRIDAENQWPIFFPPYRMPKPHPIIILDDLSHTSLYSYKRSNPSINLALRHRHLGGPNCGVTIFYLLQTLGGGLQKPIRQNIRQFSVFRGTDQNVLDDMFKEFGGLCTKEEFLCYYQAAIGDDPKSHNFLTVDKEDVSNYFRRNFDTYLSLTQDYTDEYTGGAGP